MNGKYFLPLVTILLAIGCRSKVIKSTEATPMPSSVMCAPVTTDSEWYKADNKAPLLEGLDVLDFPVSTENELAQKYFNQGLVLAYGFNHAEAARSFFYATKLDPACAMAYWGYAYVLGPNYNAGMEDDNYSRAYDAIQKAKELSETGATRKEKALINAMAARYVAEPQADRSPLDVAYADAMKAVFDEFPEDGDVGALYVESLMDLHPWDLWTREGSPKEWTPQILKVFDEVFSLSPQHPGAHHFYIHAVEASSEPERGLNSARLFDEGLVPSAGHLLHMPTHIYIQTGDYHKGTLANLRAVKADSSYLTACHAQGAYPLTLYPHNYHFMAATATLEGSSELAIMAANKVSEHANRQLMKEPGWGTIQHYYTIPYYVNVKFGKWEQILKMENEDIALAYPAAIRHYARGMAWLGLREVEKAKLELNTLKEFANDENLQEVTIWGGNNMHQLLQIATRVLEGEVLARGSQFEKSIRLLKEAVALEDALVYQEPPDWFFSVRHHLGAVQTEAQEYQDAIKSFEEDLVRHPKNGWALHGLRLAYASSGDAAKLVELDNSLGRVWAAADVELLGSRIKP